MNRAGTAARFHWRMDGVDVASGSHQWRITSFGGGPSRCGERASGNDPLGRRAKQGVASRRREARDLRRSPGPRGGHAATETDRRQLRQPTSEVPETNGSNVSGTNQLVLESIDTVGVTGSIPVSPTTKAPDSGASSFSRQPIPAPCQRVVNGIRQCRTAQLNIGRHRTTRVSVAASREDAVEPSLGLIPTHLAVIPAEVQNDLSAAGALKPSDEVPRALARCPPCGPSTPRAAARRSPARESGRAHRRRCFAAD
jgi:hypothetical protein